MRILTSYFLVLSFFFLSFSCTIQAGKNEESVLIVKHIFTSELPDKYYEDYPPDDLEDKYYIYNYSEDDFPLLVKMLDTLTIDTTYRYHSHFFLRYDSNLPDTIALKDPTHNIGGLDLNSSTYRKNFVLEFLYVKGFLSEADQIRPEKLIPDSYRMISYEGNKRSEHYYVKDSINGRLIEVDRSVVSIPDSGIR